MELRLAALAILGFVAGCFINAAIDAWAWVPKRISPWLRRSENTPPRTWLDRLPILGWWRLRRESNLHGASFWIRPLVIELLCGVGLAVLYWFEVIRLGLIAPQIPPAMLAFVAPDSLSTIVHAAFLSHALLAAFMLIASLIDIDDRIIPDEVTVLGTLLGLVLATALPMAFLPQVTEQFAAPPLGIEVLQLGGAPLNGPNGGKVYVEPVHAAAPNDWPAALRGGSVPALAIGLGCFWLWCFALTRRIWRSRRGPIYALRLIFARVARDIASWPLLPIAAGGTLAIVAVWLLGESTWMGLLSALIGLVVSGGIVWIIRIVASAAMKREAMGFGDVTLMMMVGTFIGWQAGLVTFFLAPFAALAIGILQLLLRRGDVIPYGPFLCLGAVMVIVKWPALWERTVLVFGAPGFLAALLAVCFVLLGGMLYVWMRIKRAIFRYEDE